MEFGTTHTLYGLRRMAQAETNRVAINLVAMAIGDGGGNATSPDPEQTQLVREMYRNKPNRVFPDPDDDLSWTVELIVPAAIGGFTVREAAVFDDQGGMYAVSNVPASYKPVGDGSEGAFTDTAIRMKFSVQNASVVSLFVDPNVAVATQQWIKNTITMPYLLPGGTTGQVPKKLSNQDGDIAWGDPNVAAAVVSIIEEVQTLAAGQTDVVLTECTTVGLAVYVGGDRLLPNAWAADPGDLRKLKLAAAYPEGTKVDFVQNEPGAGRALLRDRNLADLDSVADARRNLGVYSKDEADSKAPPSLIGYFASSKAPTGWLKANGSQVSRTAYAALFASIGTTYGVGDGFNTFNLPDLRGEFLRCWDDARGIDGGRALGSRQDHAFASHTHSASTDEQGNHDHGGRTSGIGDHKHVSPWGESTSAGTPPWGTYGNNNQLGANGHDYDNTWGYTSPAGGHDHTIPADGKHKHNVTVSATGATETRPRNIALLACIKY